MGGMGGLRGCLRQRVVLAALRLTGLPTWPPGKARCAVPSPSSRPGLSTCVSPWRRGLCTAAFLSRAPPRFPSRAGRAELFPFTPAVAASSRFTHHLGGEESQEMPAAPRPDHRSEDEGEPESLMEPQTAVEGSSGRKRKVKKEKSKRHKLKREKRQAEENELSDTELEPPKPKKIRKKKGVNDDVEEIIAETQTPVTNGVIHSENNSCEESSTECDSDQEQELTEEQKEGAFANFNLSKSTIDLLKARGVTYLFDVQVKTFKPINEGKDVIAQARTGTGKTFSFAIPLIEKLQGDSQERKRGRTPKVLVLAPTRELAMQVSRDFKDITKKLTVACFYGGTAYNGQHDLIRNGIDILVGTPGRIKDHLQNGNLDISGLKHVVLDEVDQMLDMGFAEQVEEILAYAYKKDSEDNPQTLLFSATCPHWVYDVAKKYMKSRYEQIDLIGKRTKKTAMNVEHMAIECHWSQRAAVIGNVIQVYSGSHGRTIIFCETKKEATELALNASIKQDAQSLHGDIPQKQREVTLKGFRNGSFGVLVATNVAARGLDIPEVDLVIQSSPPKDVDSYIHRSGRTGRAGRTGICICLYQRRDDYQLRQVEQKAGIVFKRVGVPTATDIIKASSKDAIRSLDSVPPSAIDYFRQSAERLIEEKGAVEALAAALAHISGATSIEQRSLLSSDVGYVTMTMQCSVEMRTPGYAWRGLKEQLGEDIDSKVRGMRFLKGKMGVCFDIPAAELSKIQQMWQDSRRWQLSVATALPELEESPRENGRGGGGGFGSDFRNGRRGGGFNRNDRFRNRGQKRSFDRAF
ncbi:nucleolar RNA helicase 2 isoform X2 [Sphaerodactylus townsendi]|uniref:nucleolar RNA helicase 2 isoform X2 n=1 Tax=Sphaerodactylus townsendi TaxID=933632 RepID=UPI0020268BFB|nr:nucleolar RNA helicase 2 isoform X2 [Sphaerodactylus townsendi]